MEENKVISDEEKELSEQIIKHTLRTAAHSVNSVLFSLSSSGRSLITFIRKV